MACYWSLISFPLFSFRLSCSQISESTSHTPSLKIANVSMINMKELASCASHLICSQLLFRMIEAANKQLRIISAWLARIWSPLSAVATPKYMAYFFYFWWEVGFSISTSGSVFVSEKKWESYFTTIDHGLSYIIEQFEGIL